MPQRRAPFLAGLFLATLATLTLETLNTRLLSVLTWYHLSFVAVSLAMFGMAAGAVAVYLGGARFEGAAAEGALVRYSAWLALSIPVSHGVAISIPIVDEITVNSVLSLALSTTALSAPFYLSGVVVAIALTRIPGPVGVAYGVDLLGASLGSLLVIPLLDTGSISTAVLFTGALAALASLAFAVAARRGRYLGLTALTVLLIGAALANGAARTSARVRVAYPKGSYLPASTLLREYWSIHGQVVAQRAFVGLPPFWGMGSGGDAFRAEVVPMVVDGGAATYASRWDGKAESLRWTSYDLTALPYHLRSGGDVAVIGVGGGRDVLSALYAGSRSVTGVEINHAFLKVHTGAERDFTRIALDPAVTLVHDEARSYLTRTEQRFDVIQMSLIDTWAATGAGAFTLSENGLYTVEAWRLFLARLKPAGVLSVSRWYTPADVSETSRLVSLASAAVLGAGAERPREHLVVYARGTLATLLASNQPFSPADLGALAAVAQRLGFTPLLVPGLPAASPLLERIATSRDLSEIMAAVDAEPYDYSPPTDERPFFFNLIRPTHPFPKASVPATEAGVIHGNLLATATLGLLFIIVLALVAAVIVVPLVRAGMPRMGARAFGQASLFFGLIGSGFMLLQVAFLQRFSVYLGHPTYAVVVILFSMILATGLGSFASERLAIERQRFFTLVLPLAAALAILIASLTMPLVMGATVAQGLLVRGLVTVALVAPISLVLGTFFPMGMRLVLRISADAAPWMWGINGALGVLASVIAVAISMWAGISANLYFAAAAYALLAGPAWLLWGVAPAGRGEPAAASAE